MRHVGKPGLLIRLAVVLTMALAMLPAFTGTSVAASTYDWDWQNPLPQGNTLHCVFPLTSTDIWAVGDNGTIMHSTDGGTNWSSMDGGTTNALRGVTALDDTHVWAVGDGGTIIFYNGISWTAQTSGVSSQLNAVTAVDTSHVWAVGASGKILKFNGASWASQTGGSGNITSVSAYDIYNVWAVADAVNIFFYDGTSWSAPEKNTGYTETLYGVSVADTTAPIKVTASASGSGTVSPATQRLLIHESAIINITPNPNNYVSKIEDNGVSQPITNPYIINDATVAHAVTVTFTANPAEYAVTATVSGGNGAVSPAYQSIPRTKNAAIDITPDAGYYVSSIIDNGTPASKITNPYVISNVTAAHNVTVAFTAGTPTDHEVTASVSGGHGTVSPEYVQVPDGQAALIDLTADKGYKVASITDNGTPVALADPYSISSVTEDHDVVVTFDLISLTYVVSAVAGPNGSVNPASQTIASGSNATVTITPNPGYHIAGIIDYIGAVGTPKPATNIYVVSDVSDDHLVVVNFVPDSHVWTVGADGRILFFDGNPNWPWADNNKWHLQESNTSEYLRSVSALDASHAWAVGPNGMVLFWNGTAWAPQSSATTNQLRFISALDSTHVWAVGDYGTIIFFNGTTWTPQYSGNTNQLNGISVVDETHAWSVGNLGTILYYDGATWTTQASGTGIDLNNVSALDATHVWAVGDTGTILFYNGSAWSAQASGTSNNLYGVSAIGTNFVWAVGDSGTILYFNGTSWGLQDSGTTNSLYGVSALDAVQSYTITASVSGGNGTVSPGTQLVGKGGTSTITITPDSGYHIASVTDNGTMVTPVPASPYRFNGVSANHTVVVAFAPDSVAFTVSASAPAGHGTIAPTTQQVNQGSNATITFTPSSGYHLSSITDNGAEKPISNPYVINNVQGNHDVVVVFASGAQTFTVTASMPSGHGTISPATQQINQGANATITITPNAGYHVASITDNGVPMAVIKPYVISKVGAPHNVVVNLAADSHVWVVGAGGKTLFYSDSGTNAAWTSQSNGSSTLYGVSALDKSHVWAVGVSGATRFFNGTSWGSQTSGITTRLSSVTALDINYVWAVGDGGVIRFYDNLSWSGQTSGTKNALYGVSHYDANHVWAAGIGGNILAGVSNVATYEVHASTPAGHGTVTPAYQYTAEGGTATVNIVPDMGYHLALITDNGEEVTNAQPYIISDVAEAHEVVVTFAADADTYTITASAPMGHGTVSPDSQSVNSGGTATVTISPDIGYHISSIQDNGVEMAIASPYVLNNVVMNHDVVVTFTINVLTINTSPGAHGSITPAGPVYVNYGSSQTFDIVPDVHYHVSDVKADGSSVGAKTSHTFTNVIANHTISADFALDKMTVTALVTGGHGTALPATQQVDYGSTATINITANSGYRVNTITDNGANKPTAIPYVINNVTEAHNVVVTFIEGTQVYSVKASVSGGHGTVSPTSQYVDSGSDAIIDITPDDGYKIDTITDNGESKSAADPYVIDSVKENHTVVVTFTEGSGGGTNNVWYMAEGSTNWGFDCYISIENPNSTAVNVKLTYMTSTGAVAGPNVAMPAASQATVYPSETMGAADFSTKVECVEGKPISVDRTMSWAGSGAACPEAHCATGVTSPAGTWYMPEGSSNWGFECFVLIQNPNAAAADCTVTWMIEGESPVQTDVSVGGSSRMTLNMADIIGAKDASIKVTSDSDIICERAMYRNNRREGHDSTGTPTAAADYYLAEGCTGFGFTTYILVQNPQDSATDVAITYQAAAGPVTGPAFTMPANSRKTICVNDTTAIPGDDPSFSTHVHGTQSIIAERAMYWNGGPDYGQVCHDSIGLDAPHATWCLADGQTSEGRETWTLVQNPNDADVTVEITYMTPDGTGNVVKTETIAAGSRKSFNMAEHSGITGRAAIMVVSKTSGKKVMCERAMYWNSRGTGTDTIGGYSD